MWKKDMSKFFVPTDLMPKEKDRSIFLTYIKALQSRIRTLELALAEMANKK